MPVEGVNQGALREQVANYTPVGWTPIGLSLERAAADFPAASDAVTNAIILVTDGLETCDADPCAHRDRAEAERRRGHGVRRRSRPRRRRTADHELHRRELRRPHRRRAERRRAVGGTLHVPRGAGGRRHDGLPRDRVDRRPLPAGDPDVRRAGGDRQQPAGRRAVHATPSRPTPTGSRRRSASATSSGPIRAARKPRSGSTSKPTARPSSAARSSNSRRAPARSTSSRRRTAR